MKKIVGDILKNKNIEVNLKEYYGNFMEINNKYAMVRLAMNYYMYYTILAEGDEILNVENKDAINIVNNVIKNYVDNGDNIQNDIASLENLRNESIEKAADITCYVDIINVYEHALNRVEYRFRTEDYPQGYKDEDFTRTLMQFILDDEDKMAINHKICDVLGQLPIRFTKNKFFEMLSNGFSIYKGGTKESFNDFIYRIKTTSMLEKRDKMAENFPYLSDDIAEFEKINFKEITAEEYKETSEHLKLVSDNIVDIMDGNMSLQEIINGLLVILYTKEYQDDDNITKACFEIIKNTNLLCLGQESPKSLEEIEDMFVMLEGVQEELYPKISNYDVTEQIKENYNDKVAELGLSQEYDIVMKLPKLNADSIYVDLDKVEDNSEADEEFIEKEENKLFDEYNELFANCDRMIKRAVMSAAISELPIFFNNISELQDFIYNTLSTCTDKAEKLACIEILNGIMDEY